MIYFKYISKHNIDKDMCSFKRNVKTGLLKKVSKELKIKNVLCVQLVFIS